MPTQNPRLNVVLDEPSVRQITVLARQQRKSLSAIAKQLIEQALELQEDLALSNLATQRDTPSAKTVSHAKAWR